MTEITEDDIELYKWENGEIELCIGGMSLKHAEQLKQQIPQSLKLRKLIEEKLELFKRNPQGKDYVKYLESEFEKLLKEAEK